MAYHRKNGKYKKTFVWRGNNGNIIDFFYFKKFGTGMSKNYPGSLKMVHH
jgi:hypothetical protein